jgi:hypothetical protein
LQPQRIAGIFRELAAFGGYRKGRTYMLSLGFKL